MMNEERFNELLASAKEAAEHRRTLHHNTKEPTAMSLPLRTLKYSLIILSYPLVFTLIGGLIFGLGTIIVTVWGVFLGLIPAPDMYYVTGISSMIGAGIGFLVGIASSINYILHKLEVI